MPGNGGAQLTADQVSALAAYVWSLSHRRTIGGYDESERGIQRLIAGTGKTTLATDETRD